MNQQVVCNHCDEKFFDVRNLRNHIQSGKCYSENRVSCDDCHHRYSSKSTYNRHVCRAKVEKALIIMRRERIQKRKYDAKGKIPCKREIDGVMELLDNKPWYTSKAILTIAKGSLWYEKAEFGSDSDNSDSDSDSDDNSYPSEDGGDTDFDDEVERSALTSAFESEHGKIEDDEDDVACYKTYSSSSEDSDSEESEKSEESEDYESLSEQIALLEKRVKEIDEEEKREKETKKSSSNNKMSLEFPNTNTNIQSQIEKPKPVIKPPIRPRMITDDSEIKPTLKPVIRPRTITDSTNANSVDAVNADAVNAGADSANVNADAVNANADNANNTNAANADNNTVVSNVVKKQRFLNEQYQNVIVPSKKEKHYYESDDSESEGGYTVHIDSDYSDSEAGNEIHVLTPADLKRQEEGWIPSFEYKGQSLDKIITLLNKKSEEEKLSGKFKLHPITLKRANDDNTDDSDNDNGISSNKILDIPLISKGHYIYTINTLFEHSDMYKTLLFIKTVATSTDYLEADFRLLNKLYFENRKKSELPIRVTDVRRYKMEYLNDKKVWVVDYKGLKLAKILCDNLIDTYTLTNIRLANVITELDNKKEKIQLMDMYQINKSQQHIQKLTDGKVQAKLAKRIAEYIYYLSDDTAQ